MGERPETVDTGNDFMVSVQGRELFVLRPPFELGMTRTQALGLAAWLVVLADVTLDGSGFAHAFARLGAPGAPHNPYLVRCAEDRVLCSPVPSSLAPAEALELAAWLVFAIEGEQHPEFDRVLLAVQNT